MTWLVAAGGYEVTLRSEQVVCRNAKGKELKGVPPAIKDDPAVFALRELTEWLTRHKVRVRADVDTWMVRSLPVPAVLLARVWPDEVWRAALTDLVVAVPGADGTWEPDEVGFLRDATDQGIGMVNLDGDTVRLAADRVVIPHPVRLADLDDLREFAADLGVTQSVEQLFRQTWVRPSDLSPQAKSVGDFAGGKYAQLRHLLARAGSLGYPVRGGWAVCRVFEGGHTVEARSWVGADDPDYQTETGELVFAESGGTVIPLASVGPVTWSEGMRMASALYAGRVVESNSGEKR
jgi:hypothetical protein